MWYRHAGHRLQYNTTHAYCMLGTQGYKHTLGMCNNYCFSSAAVVARTRLTVAYIACLVAYIACLVAYIACLVAYTHV